MPYDLEFYRSGSNTPATVGEDNPLPVTAPTVATALSALAAQVAQSNELLFRILLALGAIAGALNTVAPDAPST